MWCPGKNARRSRVGAWSRLNADRRIADNVADLRAGHWRKKTWPSRRRTEGRTLGLIGLGNIGAEVARRAQAFDMTVVAWDIALTPEGDAWARIGRQRR